MATDDDDSVMHHGAAALTVWTETNDQLDSTPSVFGRSPDIVEYKVPDLASLSGGRVVAFHGVIGDAMQKLGVVVQHSCGSGGQLAANLKPPELVEQMQAALNDLLASAVDGQRWREKRDEKIVHKAVSNALKGERVRWEQDRLGRSDKAMQPGTRIHIQGYGVGAVRGHRQTLLGRSNVHLIEFDREIPPGLLGAAEERESTNVPSFLCGSKVSCGSNMTADCRQEEEVGCERWAGRGEALRAGLECDHAGRDGAAARRRPARD